MVHHHFLYTTVWENIFWGHLDSIRILRSKSHPLWSTWIFPLVSEAVNGSVWSRLHLDHDMAMQCCAAGDRQSHLFGEKSGYTVVKSHYCRDLRFLTSGHPRFRTVFFVFCWVGFWCFQMFLKWKIPGKSTLLSFLGSSFGTCINGPHHRSRMT